MSSIVCLAMASAVARGAQPAAPSVVRDGPLEVDLIVTDKGQELLTAWDQGAPHITFKNVETAKRGEFITAIVRFLGCAPDAQGLCNARVDYVAKRPDGTVYGKLEDGELWAGKPAPDPGFSQLSFQYLGLVIGPQDPSGKYTVSVTVRDHNSHRTLSVSRSFFVP